MKRFLILILSLFIFNCSIIEKEKEEQFPKWENEEELPVGTRDYAQYGSSFFAYTGDSVSHAGLLSYINDGNNNSAYSSAGVGTDPINSGTYQYDITITSHFIEEIKYITQFTGGTGLLPNSFKQGFKLQYYDGSWHTLYTQIITVGFTEGKTTRSYNNGGLGFENVTKIRLWVEWMTQHFGGAPANASSYCFSLILNSAYYPDSGFRFKTNDGLIGIGKDTTAGTNKLRFYDGALVQGIPLLATNSRYATNIRIYDGAAIKALAAIID